MNSIQIKDKLLNGEFCSSSEVQGVELARIIIFIAKSTCSLIPEHLKSSCQGILAINQATGISRRIDGTNIKIPSSLVKSLIRYHWFYKKYSFINCTFISPIASIRCTILL
jgi:hypothetical protein